MKSATNSTLQYAPVVELADTPVLETGCESSTSSSLVRRTLEKVVYSNVYDMTTLSTNEERRGLVLLGNTTSVSLRKKHTSLRKYQTSLNIIKLSLINGDLTIVINNLSNTQVCRSCRQSAGYDGRHTLVLARGEQNVYKRTKDTIPVTARRIS